MFIHTYCHEPIGINAISISFKNVSMEHRLILFPFWILRNSLMPHTVYRLNVDISQAIDEGNFVDVIYLELKKMIKHAIKAF